jgi:hypothetical protein
MAGESHVTVRTYGLTYVPKLILDLGGSSLDNPSLSVLNKVPHDTTWIQLRKEITSNESINL